MKTIKCDNCNKEVEDVWVISECSQRYNLETGEYGTPEVLETRRTECACGKILAEGDVEL